MHNCPDLGKPTGNALERMKLPMKEIPPKVFPVSVKPGGGVGLGLLLVALVFLLHEAQAVVVPIMVAVVLTLVLATPVRLLRQLGVPEFIGAALLVASLLGGVSLLGATLAEPASQWWERAPASLQELIQQGERLRASIGILTSPQTPSEPAQSVPSRTPPRKRVQVPEPIAAPVPVPVPVPVPTSEDPLRQRIVSESVAFTGLVIGRVIALSLSTVATVLLLYFLLASEHWLLSRTVEAFQRRRTRALVLAGVLSAQREIGRFITALTIVNIGVGIVTTGLMTYLGLPNPVLWGGVAAILNFIPYIGPIVMMGLLVLAGVASFNDTPALILAPAGAFLGVHAIESNLVSPWFIGRQLALSRVAIILSVMFWGWMWGIAGAMLAVPILIGIRSACKRIPRLRRVSLYLDDNIDPAPSLSSLLRASAIRKGDDASHASAQPADSVTSGVTSDRPGRDMK